VRLAVERVGAVHAFSLRLRETRGGMQVIGSRSTGHYGIEEGVRSESDGAEGDSPLAIWKFDQGTCVLCS
jgi:hypothetical protein